MPTKHRSEEGRLIELDELPPCAGGLSRRGFCTLAGAGLIALGLPGCDPGDPRIQIGGLNGEGNNGNVGNNNGGNDGGSNNHGNEDLASSGGKDSGSTGGQDSGSGGTCTGSLNAGAASAITVGTSKYFSSNQLFVCRDSGGLYAMTALCTHSQCPVKQESSTEFFCNCHGATFDFNGQNPTSPAHSPLKHYALCVDSSGTIYVDPKTVVDASTRA